MNTSSRASLGLVIALICFFGTPSAFAEYGLTADQQSRFITLTLRVFGKDSPQHKIVSEATVDRPDALSRQDFFETYNRVLTEGNSSNGEKQNSEYIVTMTELYNEIEPDFEDLVATFDSAGPARAIASGPSRRISPNANQILFFEKHSEGFAGKLVWNRAIPIARELAKEWAGAQLLTALRHVYEKTVVLDEKTSAKDLNFIVYAELLDSIEQIYYNSEERNTAVVRFILQNLDTYESWSPTREIFIGQVKRLRKLYIKPSHYFLNNSHLPAGLPLLESMRILREATRELKSYSDYEKHYGNGVRGEWMNPPGRLAYLKASIPEQIGVEEFEACGEEFAALKTDPVRYVAVLMSVMGRAADLPTFLGAEKLLIEVGSAQEANSLSWARRDTLAAWFGPAEFARHFEKRMPEHPEAVEEILTEDDAEKFVVFATSLIADTTRWELAGLDKFVRNAGDHLLSLNPNVDQVKRFMRAIFAKNVADARVTFERAASSYAARSESFWYALLELKLEEGLPSVLSVNHPKHRGLIRNILHDGIASTRPQGLIEPQADYLATVCLMFAQRNLSAVATARFAILVSEVGWPGFENQLLPWLDARPPRERRLIRETLGRAAVVTQDEPDPLHTIAAGVAPRFREFRLLMCAEDIHAQGVAAWFKNRGWRR